MALTALPLVLVAGCDFNNRPSTYPLKVKVLSATNQPLADVTVIFDCPEGQSTASGVTDESGTCMITTSGKLGDGVVEGKHRVSVSKLESWEDGDKRRKPASKPIIPERMGDPATSGLEYTITKEGPREIEIRIADK